MQPIRVQRKRTKGFKLPENTVCVTRGTTFGNPFKVDDYGLERSIELFRQLFNISSIYDLPDDAQEDAHNSIIAKKYAESSYLSVTDMAKKELNGKNLACFCPLDQPCHVDVLLELANS